MCIRDSSVGLETRKGNLQGPELEVAERAPLTPVEREHHWTLSEARSQPDGFTEGVRQSEVRGLLADTDAGSGPRCGDVIGWRRGLAELAILGAALAVESGFGEVHGLSLIHI